MKGIIAVAMLTAAVSALASDLVVERAPLPLGESAAASDAYLTLSWDNGSPSWVLAWETGADAWVGNEFDISTLNTFSHIRELRVWTRYSWPDGDWDGFNVGIYAFAGVPGSLIWPAGGGRYFMPDGAHGWKCVPVDWVLPGGITNFLAAMEQCYDYPDCDPYAVDNNDTFLGRSWQYYRGTWRPVEGTLNYHNLMLRVVVSDEMFAVKPTSLGRVKALYY
ncbi:MAG: hypothetical protein PVH29_14095 [Candidatus Zixiibacteriota bacterium]